VITLDTSAVIALVNEDDPDHELVSAALLSERAPWLIPVGIAAEVGYMLETLGLDVLDAFLEDLESGAFTLDSTLASDIPRIRELVRRYHDLLLGFSDAAVVACGERNAGRVLSIDDRDFQVVARGEHTITVVPGVA
jgi:uncharacterized protein